MVGIVGGMGPLAGVKFAEILISQPLKTV